MSNKKNEKGFTLVLSLVLLLAMSLMGGGLVVIASSDHQSNNSSDQYQQTFYVAEHALLEAEKRLVENMMGPVISAAAGRNEDIRGIPTNRENAESGLDQTTACYRSFRNLSRDADFRVYEHIQDVNFFDVVEPIVINTPGLGSPNDIANEINNLSKYHYEFFSINAGSADYKSAGMSLKKASGTTQRTGSAYRIYGCGIMGNDPRRPEILIPLETIAIISH